MKRRLSFLLIFVQLVLGTASGSVDTMNSRSRIDRTYHTQAYSPERIEFQNSLIKKYLNKGKTSDHPTLLFTSGPMGSGKSFTLRMLGEEDLVDLSQYIWIDPDFIKMDLPEFEILRRKDFKTAATLVHSESILIQEILFWEALKRSKNVILDRSFKGTEWHRQLIHSIRKEFPAYSIEVVEVRAERSVIFKRLKEREVKEGRHVPEELVEVSIAECPKTIQALRPLFDRVRVFDNSSDHPILISDTQ